MPLPIENVPAEIWRSIFRSATATLHLVSSDISDNVVLLEHHLALRESVNTAYTTKCALSLACRVFHGLVEEFLYEIIIIRNVARLHSLANSLQETRANPPNRGWWCRTLYICLVDGELVETWNRGGCQSLWGLIEACPNVVDLRCSLLYLPSPRSFLSSSGRTQTFFIPARLLQLIASSYGPTLRRLELLGELRSHVKDMERMLSSCPLLEVCRLTGLEGRGLNVGLFDIISDSEDEASSTGQAPDIDWPSISSAFVSIPKLHTLALLAYPNPRPLEMGGFCRDIQKWHLPFNAGLATHAARIKTFSFLDLRRFCIWPLLGLLPAVESIEVSGILDFSQSVRPPTHASLRRMLINGRGLRVSKEEMTPALLDVLGVVSDKKLPRLRSVELTNVAIEKEDEDMASMIRCYDGQKVSLSVGQRTAPQFMGAFDVLPSDCRPSHL